MRDLAGALGGGDKEETTEDKETNEEGLDPEIAEARREAEERRKEKHRQMEAEREEMRQGIRDRVRDCGEQRRGGGGEM